MWLRCVIHTEINIVTAEFQLVVAAREDKNFDGKALTRSMVYLLKFIQRLLEVTEITDYLETN